jgi:hypothetical protein
MNPNKLIGFLVSIIAIIKDTTMKKLIPVLLLAVSISLVGCDDRKAKEKLNTTMQS